MGPSRTKTTTDARVGVGAVRSGHGHVPLESILHTEELSRRPSRPPDHDGENRALTALVQALADSPGTILQALADAVLDVLEVGSAGLSLLTTHDGGKRFYWPAIAGAWRPHVGGGTPRDFGPCGDVLDRGAPLLFKHFELRYTYLKKATPAAEEALLVPFSVGGEAVGTIWAMIHDGRRGFDAEDLRQLESLGRFASAASQAVEQRQAENSRRAALNLMEDAVLARRKAERLNADLRTTEARLSSDLANARRLCDIGMRLVGEGDVAQLHDEILDAATGIMGSDMASMQVVDEGEDALRLLAWRGFGPEFGETFGWVRPETNTSCSVARRLGRRVVVPDVETCDFIAGSPALEDHRGSGIRAVQSTPLLSRGGTLLGMMSTHWRQPHHPPEHALIMLDLLARQAADLIVQRRSEAELRESEERFRTLADNMPPFAWTADAEGRIYWFNQRWYHYTGATPGQMMDDGWRSVLHPDHVDRVTACIQGALDAGEPWEETFPLRGRDGSYRWFLTSAVPIRDAEGKVARWFGTNTDITEQRSTADELRRSVTELARSNRRKNEFLATLAHELRGPLAPIRNALHLMCEAPPEEATLPAAREMLERQVAHMVRLVDDLLDVSRISRGTIELHSERVELASAAQVALEEIRPICARKGVELTIALPSDPIFCDADPTRVAQVLANLLSNACKFTDTGGRVDLSVERDGGEVVVRVRDSGIGIAAEQLPRIFDMFAQVDRSLDRSEGGLGIGLTLVKDLVERQGGTVRARSAGLGRGSEFEVRFPMAGEAAGPAHPAPSAGGSAAPGVRRILVVDDNWDSAETMALVLQSSGNETRTAHDGVAGVEAAKEFRPDLVLLDIGMPRMNGLEAARTIRAQPWGADMVLVALTGWGQEEDRERSREAGFDEHVVKPVDHAELMRLLASYPVKGKRTADGAPRTT